MRPTGASEIATRNTLGRMNLHPPGPTDTAYTPHSAITPPVAVTGERNEWAMYVKNGPFESVGELGYLLCLHQRPWQTISLLGNYHPATNLVFTVLDHFTIATNRVRHGLVSMNSQWSNVLATAFLNCPLELAPGIRQYGMPAASVVVSRAESLLIGENIIQRRDALQPLGFRNLSDIRYTSLFDPALIMPRLTSWMAREGLVRNTCGLLGVRNNAFSVLLIGQAQRQFVNPERGVTETRTLAAQRAMATIWRDPYFSPDPHTTTLRHRMFVRNLRWYDEWEGGVDDYNPGADAF